MLSATEIRNIRFSKSVGGYKQEEVDILLDKVESDYEQFERTLREMNNRINELKGELEDYKNSQGNIQNVLVSAQKFADQIVEEAKTKSAEIINSAQASIEKITAQEQELTTAFDKKAGERKLALENDVEKIITAAEQKQSAIEKATQDCVERQQLLFNKMKVEIAAFKAEITNKYKEHLELLSSLPDTVSTEPEELAKAVSMSYETIPDIREFVKSGSSLPEVEIQEEQIEETLVEEQEIKEEQPVIEPVQTGFVINSAEFDFDVEQEDEEDI